MARNNLEKEEKAAAKARLDLQEAHNRTESTNSRGEASTTADAKSSRVPGDEAANTATGSDAKATTGEHLSAVENYEYQFRDSDSEEEDLIPVPHFQKLFGLSPSNPFEDKKEIHFLQDLNNHDQANTLHSRGRYADTMSKEKQFQKVKFQMSNFKLEGLSAEEIDRYMQATTSLVTCYQASMQEQFFLETIGEKVRGQLTKQAATLPIRGKFQVAMKNGILVLEWEKFSMRKFHEYLLIVQDFSTAKKSGDVDLHQQTKRYVHLSLIHIWRCRRRG